MIGTALALLAFAAIGIAALWVAESARPAQGLDSFDVAPPVGFDTQLPADFED